MQKRESINRQNKIRDEYHNTTKTMTDIAKEYGVSRQRVHQILSYDYGTALSDEEKTEKRAQITRKATRNYYERQRQTIVRALGGKCCKCGNSDYRVLQVDHINGGGSREVKTKGQYKYRADIIGMIEDGTVYSKYQLLCANCNWIKRFDNDERCGRKL